MKLDALILADAATVVGDKYFVHGGGFTRYEVPRLPAPIPFSALVRFLVDESDFDKEHSLRLTLTGPAGIPNIEPVEIGAVYPSPDADDLVEGQQLFMQFALAVPAVALLAGIYHFELALDGKLLRDVPLPVVVNPGLVPISPESAPAPSVARKETKPKVKRPPPPPRKARRKGQ
jgi:hypothetical protein